MRVAICDDNSEQLNIIQAAVENYSERYPELSMQTDLYDSPLLFIEEWNKNGNYDVLLLDICMPGMLGTDIAREIRQRKENPEIIFLTTSADFAIEAFTLKAAHYIVKPFSQEQFDEAMDRAIEKHKNKIVKNITLKLRSGEARLVDLNEIMYVESFSHSQNIHLKTGEQIETRQTLSELLSLFKEHAKEQFISPYKGYIVNQKSIRSIEPDKITLKCGVQIPMVKRNFKQIKDQYFAFIFDEGEH
ncbi:MAG: DNA-binding response regulator [Firmicutes bacterium HGW-Firmicutes-16]|nr:MAG: DNA-binding response regulator [Firmicutes bacterium HGW-Firmicutes-16]